MGTGTRQIATWNDINSNKRKGYNSGVECVTKKDVNSIEGLTVTESYDNKTVSSYYAGNPTTGACTITAGNYSITPGNDTISTVLSGNTLFGMTNSTRISANSTSNSSVNVIWGASGSMSLTTAQDYMSNCLFYSNCTVDVGVQYTWTMQLECILGHSSGLITSSTGCTLMGQSGIGQGVFDIAIIDRTNNTILRKYQEPFEDGTIVISEPFSSPSSNICLCFVPLQYQMTGNIIMDTGTYQYIFWGYRLLTNTLSGQLSYYPTDTKLVQYKDITRTSISFNFYYGIYNNKSSNAKLDSVAVYISTSSDPSSGTWTKIGSVDPGTVDSTKTGYISCTIPTSIDLSQTYYLKVTCGTTTYNQDWYTMWGNSANIKTISGWTSRGSAKSMTLGGSGVAVNYTGAAVLNNTSYSGGYYGRTASVAALFKIQ